MPELLEWRWAIGKGQMEQDELRLYLLERQMEGCRRGYTEDNSE